jgi:predicted DNA binding CopG/RHH family protein
MRAGYYQVESAASRRSWLAYSRTRKSGDLRTIRIDDEFLSDIKKVAADEGFDSYQTFIKVILKRYIKDKKSVLSEENKNQRLDL